MSETNLMSVLKSCSDGELLCVNDNNMTMTERGNKVLSVETSRLKRTFTLPRNPFHTTRMSKRKMKSKDSVALNTSDSNLSTTVEQQQYQEKNNNNNNKKVFRRSSWRKFINKIAQHIGGVPVKGSNNENRVPPVAGHIWGPDQTPGVTGLRNHGNTCFINAVLQCISHTDILAEYFVLDQYKIDLSRRNKLNSKKFGTKGEVTEQLALMLKALWACQYHPDLSTTFKAIVERHGNQFKGNHQQDAQEFLQWLLDKVHEDLNTASKKKYKPIKTSGRPDEVIAAEMLANHIRCNNSFVQAVFQAQFRSSLRCQRCLTQSNTFDPFHCISVQLPQLTRHNIYVTVLYTSQQPRQVKIGVSLPSDATISELRDILESDTSIERSAMLLTEICDEGFLRTFSDTQQVAVITEADPIYCIEVPQLKDATEDSTSAYVLLCWINVVVTETGVQKFGSPYTMQISRETSYEDLQKLLLKEMAPIIHDDILTSKQPPGIFQIRVSDPACIENEPHCYLEPEIQHPLFMECIDQALALCGEDGSPAHVKLVLEWSSDSKTAIIADDRDTIEEHSSVRQLRTQSLQGGCPLTLEDCLNHYTKAETLSVEDAWRCPHCQQYLPVVKTLDVWSLPDILVVHFKRFRQQTVKGRNSTKLTTMVDFPVYGFDMTPHLANNKHNNTIPTQQQQQQQPPQQQQQHPLENGGSGGNTTTTTTTINSTTTTTTTTTNNPVILGGVGWSPWKRPRKQSNNNDNTYDLYAVCYHHGTDLETGHYTAACKNPYDNQWYLYDDTKVTNLSQTTNDIRTELVNNSAYILFYQKRSGIYVGSSSNSSSAASTSSVGSMGDHWVSRMPKFNYMPPPKKQQPQENNNKKQINTTNSTSTSTSTTTTTTITTSTTTPTTATSNSSVVKQPTSDSTTNTTATTITSASAATVTPAAPTVCHESQMIKANSKETITSNNSTAGSVRKSLETKATNTETIVPKQSTTTTPATGNSNNNNNNINHNNNVNLLVVEEKTVKSTPLYTTSIYINASGDVDITTRCINNTNNNSNNNSPIVARHICQNNHNNNNNNNNNNLNNTNNIHNNHNNTSSSNKIMMMVNNNHNNNINNGGLSESDVKISLPLDERNGFYRGTRGYATLGTVGYRHTYTDGEKIYHSDDEAPPVALTLASSWETKRPNQTLTYSQSSM